RAPAVTAVHGPDVLAAGLARHAGLPWSAAIDPAAILAGGGEPLVVCGAPYGAAGAGVCDLAAVDADLVPRLEQGLARGSWQSIELRLATHAGRARRAHRLRFWRRPARLAPRAEPSA